jgi:leader peptidase (prepilin peptidase) / N-methyltransferase
METVILVVLAVLVWGSFLNVVIYRIPAGLSLVKPPSSCPACHARIKPYDNIPIVSYLLLRGKCRRCGARIPFSYVLVEILTPASFVVLYLNFSLSFYFFASCLFTTALIVLCFIDYRHKILPDVITFPGIALALIYSFFRRDVPILQALLGAAVGAGFLLLIYGGYFLVRKKEGLGLGDVTMMIMVGAYLGWVKTLLTLILGSFVGAFVGVAIIVIRKKDLQFMLPFGTFLAPAAYVALVWGDRLLAAYLNLFQ